MSLFGKKKEPKAPTTADTLQLLQENISLLEKKQEHLNGKIDHETKTARANASKNKRAAMAALKRKKLYEAQCNKLQDTIMTLQQQEIALQNLSTNVEILSTMNQVKDTMKAATKNMTVEDVDQTMDDVRDQMDIADEISTAISTPMGNDLFDDDEREAELAALEDEDIDQQLAQLDGLPAVPSRQHQPQQAAAAPRRQAVSQVDDELAQLEAEMAGM